MIKSFKLFESNKYWQERVDNIMNQIYSAKVGDILSEDIIYQYVQILHGNDDFIDGDLGERIEKYDNYQLVEVDIDKLNIDEYYLFDDLVDDYIEEYNKRVSYPPPVVTYNYKLIDGNHRSNALNKIGFNKIKVFRGLK
jgi:hypothetical protein